MLHSNTYIQRHENWGENLTIVIFMIPWYSSGVLIYAHGGGGDALCVEIVFAGTFLENEIKSFLSYFGLYAIAALIEILWCFLHNKYCILTLK